LLNPENTSTTLPWLSVRSVQPCRPPVWLLSVAAVTCLVVKLAPPSVDRPMSTGSGTALFFSCPRKPTLQTYTLPK